MGDVPQWFGEAAGLGGGLTIRVADNDAVILLIGVLIGLFVVPDEWTAPVIVAAAVLEVTETAVTWWWSRRAAPKVGPETLVGATARVVDACRPLGRVRVNGEIWQARCEAGADLDDLVRVVDREQLTLVVEPADIPTRDAATAG